MLNRVAVTERKENIIQCKFCGASSVVRYGFTQKYSQRYLCVECKRTFIDNAAPERMRYPTMVIASAITQFYGGSSLQDIRHNLEMEFNVLPDASSIYDWIFHYTRNAIAVLGMVKPAVSDTLWMHETLLKARWSGESPLRILDCLDNRSCFLLASYLSQRRLPAAAGCGRELKQMVRILNSRTRIVSGLTTQASASLVIHGWNIHYNFFQLHPGLDGVTPAEAAGIEPAAKNWKDIICLNPLPLQYNSIRIPLDLTSRLS
jgi:hypothetical protein